MLEDVMAVRENLHQLNPVSHGHRGSFAALR